MTCHVVSKSTCTAVHVKQITTVPKMTRSTRLKNERRTEQNLAGHTTRVPFLRKQHAVAGVTTQHEGRQAHDCTITGIE